MSTGAYTDREKGVEAVRWGCEMHPEGRRGAALPKGRKAGVELRLCVSHLREGGKCGTLFWGLWEERLEGWVGMPLCCSTLFAALCAGHQPS